MKSTSPAGACNYKAGVLCIEDAPVSLLASRFGTPLYVYSASVLREQYQRLEQSLSGLAQHLLICYALKANANPTLGRMLAEWGAGADVVSGGEIYLAQRMGFSSERIVFAGVGKTRQEIAEALTVGVRAFHVESAGEMQALAAVADGMSMIAPVSVRVNPDIDAGTHPHITTGTHRTKFGVGPAEALDLMRSAATHPSLDPVGLHVHIGSQMPRVQPIIDATKRVLELWDALAADGVRLRELDIGGGLGIPYRPEERPEGPEKLAEELGPLLKGRILDLVVEPGRFIVGPAGVMLTEVLYMKRMYREAASEPSRPVAIVDAGMNDLLRPALYDAWHPVWPPQEAAAGTGEAIDVAGPVCESSDFLARERRLGTVQPGDILAIGQAGAYGYSMASQYNARPRPAEVLVEGSKATLIRRRENYDDLWSDVAR